MFHLPEYLLNISRNTKRRRLTLVGKNGSVSTEGHHMADDDEDEDGKEKEDDDETATAEADEERRWLLSQGDTGAACLGYLACT